MGKTAIRCRHCLSVLAMLMSSGLRSYEYMVSTLRAMEFIISLVGAFMMRSRTKELGSDR